MNRGARMAFGGFLLLMSFHPRRVAAQSDSRFFPTLAVEESSILGEDAAGLPAITIGTLPEAVADTWRRSLSYATAPDLAARVETHRELEKTLRGETPFRSAAVAGTPAFVLLINPFHYSGNSCTTSNHYPSNWTVTGIKRDGGIITVELTVREGDEGFAGCIVDEYAEYGTRLIPLGNLPQGNYTLDVHASRSSSREARGEDKATASFRVYPEGSAVPSPTTVARRDLRTTSTSARSGGALRLISPSHSIHTIHGPPPEVPTFQVGALPGGETIPKVDSANGKAVHAANLTAVISKQVKRGEWIELNSIEYDPAQSSLTITVDYWKSTSMADVLDLGQTQVLVIPDVVSRIDTFLNEPGSYTSNRQHFSGDLSVELRWRSFEGLPGEYYRLQSPDASTAKSTVNLSIVPPPEIPEKKVKAANVSVRIEGGFDCVSCPSPEYPVLGLQARAAGTVVLSVVVAPDGTAATMQVLRGNPLLYKAAADSVQAWRFRPKADNGQPTSSGPVIVSISFSLQYD